MGKYMRKAKNTGEVAVMEVTHQSSFGVRTRARTLALQKLSTDSPLVSTSYLELRSRRLEKPPSLAPPRPVAAAATTHMSKAKAACIESSGPESNPSELKRVPASRPNPRINYCTSHSGSVRSVPGGKCVRSSMDRGIEGSELTVGAKEPSPDCEGCAEASFGENVLDVDSRDRISRETTPCSLIYASEVVEAPGSTSRRIATTAANRQVDNALHRNITSTHDMEEFFSFAEQTQQRLFLEKYNYDPVNDCPIPGRYEWVKLDSKEGDDL